MLAVRFIRSQGDDAVEALVGWTGVKQQRRMVVPVGYMRMTAADDINAPAHSFIEKALVIMMRGKLIAVADHETDSVQGCFNHALTGADAVHIACHAENRNTLRQADMFKIIRPRHRSE